MRVSKFENLKQHNLFLKKVGQVAYYYGSRTAQKLWKELCEKNCDREMDLVGVPYIVHRDDLREIAPLWRYYVLKVG